MKIVDEMIMSALFCGAPGQAAHVIATYKECRINIHNTPDKTELTSQ